MAEWLVASAIAGGTALAGGAAVKAGYRELTKTPKLPSQPRPPTIDDARRRQVEGDRLRQRMGMAGNIFGGSAPSTPTVGQKVLLGQ